MNRKDNARSQKSREAIRAALVALLEKQELSELTVSQLCREADVNRSTFYAHYQDLWDVMDELEEQMDRELLEQFHWVEDAQTAMLEKRSFLITCQQIARHPAFNRARLNNPSVSSRRAEMGMAYIMEYVVGPYARSISHSNVLPYYITFGRDGCVAVLRQWLEGGCRETPEEIAEVLYTMCIRIPLGK